MQAEQVKSPGSAVERLSLRITAGFRAEWRGRCERRGDTVRAAGVGPRWDSHEAGPAVLEGTGHTCPSEATTITELMPRCCYGQATDIKDGQRAVHLTSEVFPTLWLEKGTSNLCELSGVCLQTVHREGGMWQELAVKALCFGAC